MEKIDGELELVVKKLYELIVLKKSLEKIKKEGITVKWEEIKKIIEEKLKEE